MTNGTSSEAATIRAIVDGLPAMLAYWDANQRCRFANRAYEKWFGVNAESMLGRDMKEFLGPLYALNVPYIEGALRGEEQEFEREIPDPAGGTPRHSQANYVPDIVDGTVRGFCVLVVDITRRKQAEETLQRMQRQLQATERLAAMATLAGGIAHEINNPLAVVLANLELAIETPEPSDAKTALVEARDAAKRMAGIVHGMRLLARGEVTKRERIEVREVLEESIGISNVIRYRARLKRDFGDVSFVDADASQLVQVFVNLLVNAAQALPEDNAARNEIRVSTRREGANVVIEVADNGVGIPDAIQSRIFDPFFTTKGVGAGMGLGLSISSGIIGAFGGHIAVTSKVGEGSVFRVVIPEAAAIVPEPKPAPPHRPTTVAAEPLRVLIVDDERSLTRVLQIVLEKDYVVTVMNHGREAIAALCDQAHDFDVILCDLMMPEVSGADVYAEVARRRPELVSRFVFMTGGAFTKRHQNFLDSVSVPIVKKPFDLEEVRALIEAHR